MSFGDVGARMKKIKEKEEAVKAASQPKIDPSEVLTIRQRITGVLIRDARVAKGYTVEQTAALMNLESEAFLAWEFGQESPSLPQLELLAYCLEVPVSHFLSSRETLLGQLGQRQVNQGEYLGLRDKMIGVQLRAARDRAGFTPDYLAGRLGIPPEQLEAYEYGLLAVPLPQLIDLASALRVTLSSFLEGSDRVGAFLQAHELMDSFVEMSPELRAFISNPANHSYLELARRLAAMDTQKLRHIAELMLEITL
jgi:transcriptional regulator with XRE-family HTH domain